MLAVGGRPSAPGGRKWSKGSYLSLEESKNSFVPRGLLKCLLDYGAVLKMPQAVKPRTRGQVCTLLGDDGIYTLPAGAAA